MNKKSPLPDSTEFGDINVTVPPHYDAWVKETERKTIVPDAVEMCPRCQVEMVKVPGLHVEHECTKCGMSAFKLEEF